MHAYILSLSFSYFCLSSSPLFFVSFLLFLSFLSLFPISFYLCLPSVQSPPCQPYTRQGNQEGSKDARAKSFLHLLHLLPHLNSPPHFIALENVKGFEVWHSLLSCSLPSSGISFFPLLLSPFPSCSHSFLSPAPPAFFPLLSRVFPVLGVCAFSPSDENCYLAYPGTLISLSPFSLTLSLCLSFFHPISVSLCLCLTLARAF